MNNLPPTSVICVAGGDGSGKTTQIARLTAYFSERGHNAVPVTIWDAFADPTVASKLPFDRPSDVYGYLKLLGPVSRTHFLFHALHLALERASDRNPDVLLLNAYWYKYFATEVAHGGDPALLRQLAAGFPEPDFTFYLSVDPEEAMARKAHPSDYEYGYARDAQAMLAFQRRARDILRALALEYTWIELDGRSSPTDVTAAMIQRLRQVGCVQSG